MSYDFPNEIRAAQILSGDSGFPDDGTYSGLFWYNEGYTIGGTVYNLGGMNGGVLMWGANNSTGKFYAAGGALVIDTVGITRTGLNYFDRWTANNAGNYRTLEMGSFLPSGSSIPAAYISFYDSAAGTNLQVNGDIELGALTDFDAVNSASPTWSAATDYPRTATYAAKLATTGESESNLQVNGDFELGALTDWTTGGTGTWSADNTTSHGGTWSAKLATTASQTGTLTTNLGATPRMAVTAGLYYNFRAWTKTNGVGAYTTLQFLIKWYTATSGGALISTDTVTAIFGSSFSETIAFSGLINSLLAPATAAGAEIIINVARSAAVGNGVLNFDDITFAPAQYGTLTTNLGGTPRMAVTGSGSYAFSMYSRIDTYTLSVQANAYVKWYTAASGGSLISTNTVPYVPGLASYLNNAITLTAPSNALGAEIQLSMIRGNLSGGSGAANIWFDDISFTAVTVSRSIKFLPNVTITDGPLDIQEQAAPATPASGYISRFPSSVDHADHTVNQYGQNALLIPGGQSGRTKFSNTAAEQTLCSFSIGAGALGANGFWIIRIFCQVFNNTGAGRAYTFKFKFGSYTFTRAITFAASAAGRAVVGFTWEVHNDNATGTQYQMVHTEELNDNMAAATPTNQLTPANWWDTSSIDTTAATTPTITCTMATASSSETIEAVAVFYGPFYKA